MSARVVVPLFAASWLLRLCCLIAAESEHTTWVVSTTPFDTEETSPLPVEDNGLSSEADTQPTTDGGTTENEVHTEAAVTGHENSTPSSDPEYDPGTKFLMPEKAGSGSEPDDLQNQVYNSECNSTHNSCGVVVNTLNVVSDIRFRYARTIVYSKIGNPGNNSNQATFSVMLPDTAFISRFLLEMNGKVYEAYVKKKVQAEKEYQEALESGHTAAHVGNSARDSNVFVISVNVAARSKVSFNLTYEELLSRRLSAYHHTITLTPGQVVQDLNVDVFIEEIRNITLLNVTTSDDGRKLQSGGDGVFVQYINPLLAHVKFIPSVSDQQSRLDVGLFQLNVEYDVDRAINPSGDIMLMDGYFVHFFAPEDVTPQPKHIIFVLDTSGSMWGRKLQQLQQAMYSILDNLRKDDYFSLVQFSTNVMEWTVRPQDMVGLSRYSVTHEVTESNIAKAKQYIKSMEASGGTNISGALRKALQLAAKQKFGTSTVDETGEKRDFGTEDRPQPMLVFLTDGIATVGELLTSKILAQVRAINTEIRAAVFSLAFGDGANYRFLKKLSLQNHAFARKIYEASDAALQLQSFYNEIASPLLSNVSFAYLDGKIDKHTLTNNIFHSYYSGSEIIVAGKVNNSDKELQDEDLGAEISAWSGGEHKEVSYKPHYTSSKFQIVRKRHSNGGTLERLWAYLTVCQLLDEHLATENEPSGSIAMLDEKQSQVDSSSPKERALDLALKYGFVTPLTSLVVTIPANESEDEVSELVKDPMGSNMLDPSPLLESVPLQNKIMALPPFHFRPTAMPVRPLTGIESSSQTTTVSDFSMTDLNDFPHVSNFTLADISWLLDYFDSEDRLIVTTYENATSVNSTYLVGELVKSAEIPDNAEECTTPEGVTGKCHTLAGCVQSEFMDDYEMFLKYFCSIGKYAGVCCPYYLLNNNTAILTEIPLVV